MQCASLCDDACIKLLANKLLASIVNVEERRKETVCFGGRTLVILGYIGLHSARVLIILG